ncbi:bromodomain-containing protein 8-like isoform X2 [Dysidea avara]|uniref:bromodomain-containing protein 8-like isoform X2 n=1 Tax=Dysidea avara TaxID=196820 RepID=UPI00331F9BBC
MQVARAESRGTQWTVREQLILGSAVQRSGDQNWVSVSRTIRPLSEEDRQPEFYSQKNCALNYAALLDNASTPKRKKKRGSESERETTQDLIVRDLTEKRLIEINNLLEATRIEYNGVKKDLEMIENGEISDEDMIKMWNKVKDEEKDMVAMEQVSHHDEGAESIVDQSSDVITPPPKEKPVSNKPTPPSTSKPALVTEATSKSNTATPLIATPIVTPMISTSATTIKIEPNVAMETIAAAAAKPVQVKVLSHDDHTYSSPGPPTLLSTPETANEMLPSSDRITPTTPPATNDSIISQVTTTNDQVTGDHDQDTTTADQAIVPAIDQAPSNLVADQLNQVNPDQAINVDQTSPDKHAPTVDDHAIIDQASSTDDQVTNKAVTGTKEPSTPTEKQTAVSTEKQATPIEKQDTPTEKQDTPTEKHVTPAEKQTTPTEKEVTPTEKQATPSVVITPANEQVTPMKEQATSSKEQFTPTGEEVTPTKEQATPTNEQVTPTQQATPVSPTNTPVVPATEQAATPTTEKATPTSEQVTPTANEATPSADADIEKKTRTRGSSRISGKMKVPQVSRKKASSPRTMVIIGKQPVLDSDGEDVVPVRHKGAPRRLHRLLSNEPSESEEEPLSAVTSGMTSPSSSMIDSEVDPEVAQSMKMWRKSIMLVWQHASQHKFASLFLHAVKDEEATGYSEVVFRPMDLSLIKKKIETGVIRTDMDFQRDMLLMFQNALMYNSSNHDVHMMAEEMRKDVMENIQDYLATQLMVHSTAPAKILRSRDSSRRMEHVMSLVGMGDDSIKEEDTVTPLRKTRHRLPSDDSISSIGTPAAKKLRTKASDD